MSKQITYSPFIKESSYKYDTKVIHIFQIVEVSEVLGNEDREARCSSEVVVCSPNTETDLNVKWSALLLVLGVASFPQL